MFKKLRERMKAFDEFQSNGLLQLAQDYSYKDKDNVVRCSKCGSHLGLFRMIFHAMQVERGELYKVVCKDCKFVNIVRRSKLDKK